MVFCSQATPVVRKSRPVPLAPTISTCTILCLVHGTADRFVYLFEKTPLSSANWVFPSLNLFFFLSFSVRGPAHATANAGPGSLGDLYNLPTSETRGWEEELSLDLAPTIKAICPPGNELTALLRGGSSQALRQVENLIFDECGGGVGGLSFVSADAPGEPAKEHLEMVVRRCPKGVSSVRPDLFLH